VTIHFGKNPIEGDNPPVNNISVNITNFVIGTSLFFNDHLIKTILFFVYGLPNDVLCSSGYVMLKKIVLVNELERMWKGKVVT
jgi:hypothetical protein